MPAHSLDHADNGTCVAVNGANRSRAFQSRSLKSTNWTILHDGGGIDRVFFSHLPQVTTR